MKTAIPRLTVSRAHRLLASGALSSQDLAQYCHALAVAGEELWRLNAFVHLVDRGDLVLKARDLDDRRRLGETSGMLHGIPVSVKANLAVSDFSLTAGSKILGSKDPGTPACGFDAQVVTKLRANGALIMGSTNMDEFGMGSLGTNAVASDLDGSTATRNPLPMMHRSVVHADAELIELIQRPYDAIIEDHFEISESCLTYSAGGSSCGSAVSVAHGSSLISLGSDTGGSVRLPASWCGVVGLKPSYGVLSRHGLVSYASSLDTVGILGPSVECVGIAFEQIRNTDEDSCRDSTGTIMRLEMQRNAFSGRESMEGIKIGIPAAFSVEETPPFVAEAWTAAAQKLEALGAIIVQVSSSQLSPDLIQNSLAAYYVLASAEASSNLSRYDGLRYGVSAKDISENADMTMLERQYAATRSKGFGKEVARRILCGTSVLSSDRFHTFYEAAATLRAAVTQEFVSCLAEVDVLLTPTTLSLPPLLGETMDATEMFANDIMTVPVSLAGLPAISVPTLSSGDGVFRVGIQLIGGRQSEGKLFRVAHALGSDHGD
jgi:aspartyl-tRNA(Asn)/glutamyl-tRNA(Gln) amidotransferase subunit A